MVVFPAPLGPMMEKILPFSTTMETPLKAAMPPNEIHKSSMERRAIKPLSNTKSDQKPQAKDGMGFRSGDCRRIAFVLGAGLKPAAIPDSRAMVLACQGRAQQRPGRQA